MIYYTLSAMERCRTRKEPFYPVTLRKWGELFVFLLEGHSRSDPLVVFSTRQEALDALYRTTLPSNYEVINVHPVVHGIVLDRVPKIMTFKEDIGVPTTF